MRTKACPYLMATLVVAIFPAGARADAKTAEPTRNACGRADVRARLAQAAPVEIASLEKTRGGPYGSVSVAVTLAPDGKLLQATVLRSSGNLRLDDSALEAIRSSTYSPEQRSCGNVGGTYQVEADLDG